MDNVFSFQPADAIAGLFYTLIFGLFFGFLIGLMRYMMIGVFERKD